MPLFKALKKILLLGLFPLFFILHGYNENFGLIPFGVMSSLFLYYFAITAGIFLISLLFLRNIEKAFVFSFCCLCIFFFFGVIYDALKNTIASRFFTSYSFLFGAIFSVLVILFFLIKKKLRGTVLSSYITWVLCAFVLLEIALGGYNAITGKYSKTLLYHPAIHSAEKMKTCTEDKPDIFFIVLDEYSSSEALAKYFNFNNQKIDSLFVDAGFYVSTGSRSNYNMTFFSLSSTFNYDFLEMKKKDSVLSNNLLLRGIETFKKNRLTSFLSRQGYDILNYGCFKLDNSVMHVHPYFNELPEYVINNQTIVSRASANIGWNFRIKNIFTGKPRIPVSYKKSKEEHLNRNSYNAEYFIRELSLSSDKPRFVYGHLMLPHDPYYLDSAGNFVSDTVILRGKINREKAYMGQLIYANTILRKIIAAAQTKTGREKVVIIEGDHGFGDHNDPQFSDREFSNLNAYYFSDKNYSSLYNSISPVNTFRVILNKYFCQQLPLLKDSSIYIRIKKQAAVPGNFKGIDQ